MSPERLARLGERIAADFLMARGARVRARNLRRGRHEIDLLVDVDGGRVLVEVKTRAARSGLDPVEQFDERKADALRAAGRKLRPPPRRYDLVTVVVGDPTRVRWIRDVC